MKLQTITPEARSIARGVFDSVLGDLEFSSVYEHYGAEDLPYEEQRQIYWYVIAMLQAVDTAAIDAQVAVEVAAEESAEQETV